MEFGNKLLTQLKSQWEQWSAAQRIGMLATLVVSACALVGIGLWASTPEYVTLTDHLTPQQAAEAVSVLEAAKIPYKLNYSGSAVLVDRSQMSRARLAIKDIAPSTAPENVEISDGLWTDPTMQQVRLVRQLEGRLARSIMQISSVRSATVHLTQPESKAFVRDRTPAKASVILELQPNSNFSGGDARSIVSLLAHSVEHLDPEHISVLDTSGRLLSSAQGIEADVSGQLSYRGRIEADLASKAETILTQMLGPGKAVVRVTADVDFTETQRRETRFDPDRKVKISETIHTESHTAGGAKPVAAGAAGASANVDPLAYKSGGNNAGGTKVESNTTTYDNAKTEDTVREAPGRVKRLTIAAVVQLPEAAAAGADGQTTAGSSLNEEKIQRIIKQAVGFDESRQDQIEVLIAPLSGIPDLMLPVEPTANWSNYIPLLRNVSLGIASLVALALGLLTIRRLQPIVVETPDREQLPADAVLKIADLSQQALQHPDAVATVLRAWLEPPAQDQSRRHVA